MALVYFEDVGYYYTHRDTEAETVDQQYECIRSPDHLRITRDDRRRSYAVTFGHADCIMTQPFQVSFDQILSLSGLDARMKARDMSSYFTPKDMPYRARWRYFYESADISLTALRVASRKDSRIKTLGLVYHKMKRDLDRVLSTFLWLYISTIRFTLPKDIRKIIYELIYKEWRV